MWDDYIRLMGLISSYSLIFTINSVHVGVCLYYDLTVYQQKDTGADISELYQTRLKLLVYFITGSNLSSVYNTTVSY